MASTPNEILSPVLVPKIQKLFNDEIQRIDAEQITPWIMGFAVGKLNILNFNKKPISYGGIGFEGSPQHVFWGRYIEPFLEDFIMHAIEQIAGECSNNNLNLEIELKTLDGYLKTLIVSTFNKMASAEQRMLGKGYPERIPKRSVDIYINAMNQYLEQHLMMEIAKYSSRVKKDAAVKMDSEYAELKDPKHEGRIARWEEIGVDAIRADLNSGGTRYIGAFEKQRLAWKWVKFKDAEEKNAIHKASNAQSLPVLAIEEIVKLSESDKLEYKSTFQWDIKENQKSDEIRKASLKTIAAFLNTEGGTLVIGVADDRTIIGLDYDLLLVKGKNTDGFELAFRDLFDKAIGAAFARNCKVRFETTKEARQVCIIDVVQSKEPVFLKSGDKDEFYVRRGNSSKAFTAKEQHEYTRQHFKS